MGCIGLYLGDGIYQPQIFLERKKRVKKNYGDFLVFHSLSVIQVADASIDDLPLTGWRTSISSLDAANTLANDGERRRQRR